MGYDPEGYSMWFCDYKYIDENTVNFVVMNKVRAVRVVWAHLRQRTMLVCLVSHGVCFRVYTWGVW